MSVTARVITRFGAELLARNLDTGELLRCTAKRKFEHIACGDYVTVEIANQGNAQVIGLDERKNALIRPDYSGRPKTIAANIDQLVIISSWHPQPFLELIDRYLITARVLDAEAAIVFNKHDLSEQASAETHAAIAEFSDLGYPVVQTIAANPLHQSGITGLQPHLDNKTSILVGQSGVGKSSLAKLLMPDTDIKVGEVSESGEGKHTTTTTTLYELSTGGFLIDSPGVRDFVLHDIEEHQIRSGFGEFLAYSRHCKFSNCSHQHEPGCAVKQALDDGQLPAHRYQRYLKACSAS